MATLLLAETDLESKDLHEIENICHSVGLSLILHYKDDDLDEIFDLADLPVVAFSPKGNISLDRMIDKYNGNVMIVIGGFKEDKDLDPSVYERADDTVSLGSKFLTIPEVVEQIIDAYGKK